MEPPAGGGALLRRSFGRWRELTKSDTSWQVVVGSTEHGTVGGWTSFSSSPSKKSSVTKLERAEAKDFAAAMMPQSPAGAGAVMPSNVYGADGARPSAAFAIVGDSRSPPYRSPLTDVTDDAYMRERAVTIAAAGEAAPPPVRTAIVTGGTSGVGREVVRGLRQAGLALVLVARDGERGRAVCDEERLCTPAVMLTSELPPLECVECDLASIESVQACADEIKRKVARIHVVVNCAGIVGPTERTLTPEGNELTVATNVLGPHLLVTELLERLEGPYEDDNPGRVILATCAYAGGLNIEDLQCETEEPAPWSSRRAYRASRQATYLLAQALDRRLRQRFSRISVDTFTPGPSDTPLFAAWQACAAPAALRQPGPCAPPAVGAESALLLATRNNGRSIPSGSHYRNAERYHNLPPELTDVAAGEKLWEAVEAIIGPVLEKRAAERRALMLAESKARREAEDAAELARFEEAEAKRAAERDVVKETFDKFDKDGGGSISRRELKHAMKSLGVELSKRGMKQLMQRFDEDGSGEIELEEFRAMMAAVMPKAPDTTDHA